MDDPIAALDRHRRFAGTPSGPASVIDTGGDGPTAVPCTDWRRAATLWRRVIVELAAAHHPWRRDHRRTRRAALLSRRRAPELVAALREHWWMREGSDARPNS